MGCFLLLYVMFHLLLLLLHFPSYTFSLCNSRDSSALLQFKNSVAVTTSSYDYWLHDCSFFSSKTESWKNGTDCCEWDGVTCDTMSGHVIGLNLSCSNLEGQFHPNSTIFKLRHLQQLNLAFNDFSGSSLYSGIGDLVNLTHLSLANSGIGGDIPYTISHLSKLVSLDLSSQLVIPDDPSYLRLRLDPYTWNKLIHNATNLRELYLDGVDMSSIKESSLSLLANLSSSLVSLSLQDTKLQGNCPTDILCLPNLQILNLYINKNLRGEFPKSNWSTPLRYLDLPATAFSGHIPNSIGHLKFLEFLRLLGCNFDGLIPSSLFNLTQLSLLHLTLNKLVGPITREINKLSKLWSLDLSNNMLNGTIPHWCYSLPSLFALHLSGNNLTGSISEFSTYSLQHLGLSNNKQEGNFPNSIFKLVNLSYLDLSSTELRDHVVFDQFSKLKNLLYLDLSHNSFLSFNFDSSNHYVSSKLGVLYSSSCNVNGFPKFLAQLQNLKYLDLSNNKIRGNIPKWLREKLLHSWKNIIFIDLSFNKLQGDLPILPNGIEYFLVSNNELTGDIPSTKCNASSLNVLNLAHNNLTGLIPQCLATFPSLSVLDLQMNNLYGNTPQNFPKNNAFETIKLNGNRLEGPLPQTLAHCTRLQVLDLGSNNIEDTFPPWLETLPELQVLSLPSNKFHGAITYVGTEHPFPSLRIFDVSNNNFSGHLPASYIKNFQGMMSVNESQTGVKYMGSNSFYNDSVVVVMKGQYMELVRIFFAFTTIDLSNNMFEGEIPEVIGELHSLIGLNISHNAITGTIPQSMAHLRNLEWLDLSWNQLRGEIPMALTNLNFLAVLNLSQNQFEGMIPTGGQFNTFGNNSYGGNSQLCGIPLSKACNKDEEWLPHSTLEHEESGFGWKAVIVGYACGILFGVLLGSNVFMTGKPQWLASFVEPVLSVRVKRTNNRIHANRGGMS